MIKKVLIIFLIISGFFSMNPIKSLGQQPYFLDTRFDWIRNILSYSPYYKDRLLIRSYPFPFWFNIYGRPTGYYNYSFNPFYLNFTGYPFNAYYVNRPFYFNTALYPPLEVPFYAPYPFDISPILDVTVPEALHTSLVLVRKDSSGGVVLRYVRGETLHPEGTYVWKDQEVALPKQGGVDDQQISAPSSILFPETDRIYAARAIIDYSANTTTIHIADSGYATMLYESESRVVIERPLIIDSSVILAYINEELLLVWREGNILKAVRSYDGESWSAPEDLFNLPDGVFSLWSSGDRIYLAYTSEGGLQINLTYTDGITFGRTLIASTQDPVKGLSVSTEGGYIYLAYATQKYIRIARGTIDDTFEAFHEVIDVPSNDPNYKIHAVTIHSSPYGWALQYIASYLSTGGIEYTIFGRRSQDGLDYSGTSWTYNTSSDFLGPTCMTLTPTPMPWIVKTHDSGKDAEEVYNFLIIGDGFTYGEKEKFMDAAKGMRDNIINRAPFFYNKDLFNIWAVNTFSKDSGFDSSDTVDDKDTIFNGHRITGTTMVSTERDGIRHARRIITGDPYTRNFYGFALFNSEEGETVGILPWDTHGVPLSIHRINSQPAIHEYMHTSSGGFALGDHDRHNQPAKNVNKSFDSILDETGAHSWQHWFVFEGPSESRLIEVTDDYRNGLIEWISSGEDESRYHTTHFAYSEDTDSPHYVDALSLFNAGLWESELTDVDDLSSSRQYSALRACAMNSLLHHAQIFCPVCSEIIVKTLQKAAGIVDEDAGIFFDVEAFQRAPGVYLEFQARNRKICEAEDFPPAIDLENLVEVNGHTIATSDISSHESEDWTVHLISRIDITPYVTPGTPATVIFKQRSPEDEETRIWLPGIQILNGRGARYPMQPVGEALIQRLHEKHAPECDYEYWDLSEGDLTLTFLPIVRQLLQMSFIEIEKDSVSKTYRAYQLPEESFRIVCQEPCSIDEDLIIAWYYGFKNAKEHLMEVTGIDVLPELMPVDIHLNNDHFCGEYNPSGLSGWSGSYPNGYMCTFLAEKDNLIYPFTIENAPKVEAHGLLVHEYTHILFYRRHFLYYEDMAYPLSYYVSGDGLPPNDFKIIDPCDPVLDTLGRGKLLYELCHQNGFQYEDLAPSLIALDALYQSGDVQENGKTSIYKYRRILSEILGSDTLQAYLDAGYHPAMAGDSKVITPSGGLYSLVNDFITLDVPSGAVAENKEVILENTVLAPSDPGYSSRNAFDLSFKDLTFNTNVNITVRYYPENFEDNVNEGALRLYQVVGARPSWSWMLVTSATVDTINKTVSGDITNLGTFAIMEIP